MQSTNKASTVAISMLLFFGLMIIASMTYNTLGEPEMTRTNIPPNVVKIVITIEDKSIRTELPICYYFLDL